MPSIHALVTLYQTLNLSLFQNILEILSRNSSQGYCTMSGDAMAWSVLHVEGQLDRISMGLC